MVNSRGILDESCRIPYRNPPGKLVRMLYAVCRRLGHAVGYANKYVTDVSPCNDYVVDLQYIIINRVL